MLAARATMREALPRFAGRDLFRKGRRIPVLLGGAMNYVDGFVVAVPAANKDAYLAAAGKALPLFKEFGALRLVECWGDDVPDGKLTDFRRSVKA
jgi:hypothetical protein